MTFIFKRLQRLVIEATLGHWEERLTILAFLKWLNQDDGLLACVIIVVRWRLTLLASFYHGCFFTIKDLLDNFRLVETYRSL